MAITYKDISGSEANITINNGDLEAMKQIMEEYGFVDQEALLRYALVALISASDNNLYIKNDSGNIVALKIAERLIKKNGQ